MPVEIIIDLKNSSNTKYIEGNLIHQEEYERVVGWLKDQLSKATIETKNDERLHEIITILGTRGSGKSSFLLSLLQNFPKTHNNVEVLEIIDPTLIEEKGHVFLDIISRIKDLVDEKLEMSEVDATTNDYLKKKKWHDLVKSLAYGLPLLDGLGGKMTENNWQDAEFIMSNGIRAVSAARKLEATFRDFIKMALLILNKDAFIIAFDDIDIDFKKGWRVLETIRKYFVTPKIISLITGDIKLFSKAIRKQQWENFGKALLKNEADGLDRLLEFNDLVTEMEGQYMQKVMKPQKRIHLTTISEKITLYKDKYDIKIQSSNGTLENIINYYDNVLARFGVNNTFYAEPFRSFLMSLPFRAQIQFLNAVDLAEQNKDDNGNSVFENNFLDAFANDLLEKKVDYNLAVSSPKFLNIIILKLLIKERQLEDSYQLQPTTDDVSLNSSLVGLSFLFSKKVTHEPFLIFEYLIKIGYLRNLASSFEGNRNLNGLSIDGLMSSSGLLQDKVLRDVVGSMTAYIRANLNLPKNSKSSWGGTIVLPGLADNKKRAEEEVKDRIDRVFDSEPSRTIAYIPLSIAQYSVRNDTMLVYSIYGLLATIGEITRAGINIGKGLLEYSQLRNYPMPDSATEGIGEIETFISDYQNIVPDITALLPLENALASWIEENGKLIVSPFLLGKISTRLHFALKNIEGENNRDNLGEMFNDRIISFMNAVLIEDIKEKDTDVFRKINLGNTNYSDKIFTDNLNSIAGSDDLPLFKLSQWMLTCPLLLVYIKPELVAVINKVFLINKLESLLELSVYNKMTFVRISGRGSEIVDPDSGMRGTPWELETYRQVIASGSPFEWFRTGDRKETRENNKQILASLSSLFPNDKNQASTLIKNFRIFLSRNNIQSW